LACQELQYPKGVCWKSILDKSSIIVHDVHAFPDHIACDARAKSEIVVPLFNAHKMIVGVLDVDSSEAGAFDESDALGLQKILELLPMEKM
jgi:L-methionine (R)-S-oxide reductase